MWYIFGDEHPNCNISILGIFAEKPFRKPLERNVYILITTSSRQTKPWLSAI